MIEQELLRVQQRPKRVFQDLFLVGRRGNGRLQRFQFLGGRLAGQAANVKFLDNLFRCLSFLEATTDEVSLGNFGSHRVAVEQVQGLGQVRFHLDFAGTDAASRGAAEGRQEVGARVAVGDLHGAGPERQARELVLGVGDLADRIQQDLRHAFDAASRARSCGRPFRWFRWSSSKAGRCGRCRCRARACLKS